MEESLRGYIAGLIDGEGSIYITRDSRLRLKPRLVVVTSVNRKFVEHIKDVLNTSAYIAIHSKLSYGRRPTFALETKNQEEIIRILSDVLPHLILKKRQAELMLKFIAKKRENGRKPDIEGQQAFYREMKKLNEKPLPADKSPL